MIRHKTSDKPVAFRAAGCFCLVRGHVLLTQRQAHKPLGLHWGIPTGKIEDGETPRQCIVRELGEEIGLKTAPGALSEIASYLVGKGSTAFEYVAFALLLEEVPLLHLAPDEVRACAWMPVREVQQRPAVPYFYNTLNDLLDWLEHGKVRLSPLPQAEANKPRS
ncbi:NUDIX hydrolase [Devosia sp. RR2S18]|uniref:NUDIX hydrolase n=1 Tax=Devosia rhizosphaerae TaxID=3049774 RepID=UPI00254071ED|nr:NUDIX hydrolase [Devosia sp. RR2S18]WIJ24483.1 NUDIX hydrolase [Devosia sp. RR2S18]